MKKACMALGALFILFFLVIGSIFLINQYRRQEILRIERDFTEKTGIDSHYEMDPGLFRLRPSPQKFKDWLYIEIGRDQILHGDYPKELKDEFRNYTKGSKED